MSSKAFLAGDSDPLFLEDDPDVLLALMERHPADEFVRVEMLPYARDEHARPAYVKPRWITAVLPLHPKERDRWMDDTPSWLED